MNEKWKRFARSALTLVLVAAMVVGNVRVAEAGQYQTSYMAYLVNAGDTFEVTSTVMVDGVYQHCRVVVEILEGSDIYVIPAYFDNCTSGYKQFRICPVSRSPFKANLQFYKSSSSEKDVDYNSLPQGVYLSDFTSSSYDSVYHFMHLMSYQSKNEILFVRSTLGCLSSSSLVPSVSPQRFDRDEGNIAFYDYLFSTDIPLVPSPAPDLLGGALTTNLGYLKNLRYKIRMGTQTQQLTHSVVWDNEHSDWDDSYRVAHYIQFTNRADTDPTVDKTQSDGVLGSLMGEPIESGLIFMDDVPYSSCGSTVELHSDKYLEESAKFKEYLESQLAFWEKDQAVFGMNHYLIIYRETDAGIQYGYWNFLANVSSTGACPEHIIGTMDSEGNFIKVENFGKIETEVGKGDTLEDAEKEENNVKYDAENDHDQPPSLDNIDNLFTSFFSSMSGLVGSMGKIPTIIAEVLAFLPVEIIGIVSLGLSMLIILRILGR